MFYYFYDDAEKIIYYSDSFPPSNFIYLGTSDNPRPKMAAAAFTQGMKVTSGYKIRPYP